MTRKTIVTCECCELDDDPVKSHEMEIEISMHRRALRAPAVFDLCEDCIAKIGGHEKGDKRCFKAIAHLSQQAVLAMFKSEVKKFDSEHEREGGRN